MPWRGEKNERGLHQGFLRLFSVAEPITDLIVKTAVFIAHTLVLLGKNAQRTAISSYSSQDSIYFK